MSCNSEQISGLADAWIEMRSLTIKGLDQLGPDLLSKKLPRPGLNTILKHFDEMLNVGAVYIRALTEGSVDFSTVPGVDEFPGGTKWADLKQRGKADLAAFKALGTEFRSSVSWEDEDMPASQIFVYLISHETLHQGQISAFLYAVGAEPPEAWRAQWAMPQAQASQ